MALILDDRDSLRSGRSEGASSRATGNGLDLLRLPVVGRFLRWKHSRRVMQTVLLVVSVAMILHGFFGPQLAPRNLATVLTWVHYRGLLVLFLLVAGNLFCMACPFMLPRNLARRFVKPGLNWPKWLRNKSVAIVLFVAILFGYELYDLWGSPWWTAWLIVGYFAAALLVDAVFKNAAFCKFVCPIGQFNFVASAISPLEVKVHNHNVCATCKTVDCIKGTRSPNDAGHIVQRGCELALFQPAKKGNMDCTFCLDCVYACPHDNIGITTRLPGSELWTDPRRSGIGRFSKRPDLGILVTLFTFGALLNAFGMVSPVYAVQAWIADRLGTTAEAPVLATLFFIALVVEPVVLVGSASYLTRRLGGGSKSLLSVATRFSYALIPLGFGVWLSHYSFHLLTGFWTVVPAAQQALVELGFSQLNGRLLPLRGLSTGQVLPLELGFLALGALGSLIVAYRIAGRDYPNRTGPTFAPWAVLCVILWLAAVWLMNQPMEMRGTFLGT